MFGSPRAAAGPSEEGGLEEFVESFIRPASSSSEFWMPIDTPEDMAKVAVFLASELSDHITGEAIIVNKDAVEIFCATGVEGDTIV